MMTNLLSIKETIDMSNHQLGHIPPRPPPEIPGTPQPGPEIEPPHWPEPEIPQLPPNPATPEEPEGPGIVPDPALPEIEPPDEAPGMPDQQ